jgi:hypothetical protein
MLWLDSAGVVPPRESCTWDIIRIIEFCLQESYCAQTLTLAVRHPEPILPSLSACWNNLDPFRQYARLPPGPVYWKVLFGKATRAVGLGGIILLLRVLRSAMHVLSQPSLVAVP